MGRDDSCGFEALYCRAIHPSQVAQWAGIQSETVSASADISEPPPSVEAAFGRLDELSLELALTSDRDLGFLIDDAHLAYVVGLDQPNNSTRLRAVIIRAYAEADLLARAFVAEKQDLAKVHPLAKTLAAARNELSFVDDVCRWRWESEDVRSARREAVQAAETALALVQQMLPATTSRRPKPGRREAIPKLFFVMRLAEVFAILTGERPIFHAPEDSSAQWLKFVESALEAVAFPTGTQGLDRTLRAIGRMVVHRWAIEDMAMQAAVLQSGSAWSAKNRRMRKPIQFGELQSNGLLIDYRVPMPWDRDMSTG